VQFVPHEYQSKAINEILTKPYCGLFLDMGLGKTIITLMAVNKLLETEEVKKVLIIAPLRVAKYTWTSECDKWEGLDAIKIKSATGSARERDKALLSGNVHVINRENVPWLVTHLGEEWDYDMVVVDELSSFKSPKSKRFLSLVKVRGKIKRVVGLTGTPISNGLLDLWSQIFLLDEGKSLGANYYGYLNRYFVSLLEINGRTVKWGIRPDNANKIKMAIKPFCLSMQAKDYLNLPQRIDNYIDVYPLEKEHELFLSILNSTTKEELDELVLTGKRLQFANGAVYTTETEYTIIHDHKTDALKEMLEVENEPVIIFYQYKHDLQRISALLRHDFKNKKVSTLETAQDVQNWNLGLTGVLLLHPASAGHGLNLQQGGNKIIWFGLTWSLELYQQANARLHRQGQTKPTFIHHIISKGTIDEVVIKALQTKGITQSEVLEAIKNG